MPTLMWLPDVVRTGSHGRRGHGVRAPFRLHQATLINNLMSFAREHERCGFDRVRAADGGGKGWSRCCACAGRGSRGT